MLIASGRRWTVCISCRSSSSLMLTVALEAALQRSESSDWCLHTVRVRLNSISIDVDNWCPGHAISPCSLLTTRHRYVAAVSLSVSLCVPRAVHSKHAVARRHFASRPVIQFCCNDLQRSLLSSAAILKKACIEYSAVECKHATWLWSAAVHVGLLMTSKRCNHTIMFADVDCWKEEIPTFLWQKIPYNTNHFAVRHPACIYSTSPLWL